MQTMYHAKVNSPITELAAAIDDIQTTISVVDTSTLPAAPNLAVIGNGETAETIQYTGVSGNDLTGCVRGFQGTSKAWSAGVKVARNYTAYDHDAFVQNIEELQAQNESNQIQATTLRRGLNAVYSDRTTPVILGSYQEMEIPVSVPKFDSGQWSTSSGTWVDDTPTKTSVTVTAQDDTARRYVTVSVQPNTDYKVSIIHNARYAVYDNASNPLHGYTTDRYAEFNSGANNDIRIYLASQSDTAGTYFFEDVQLLKKVEANGGLKGQHRVNILGKDGDCETLDGWMVQGDVALSTAQKHSGDKSFKFTSGSVSYAHRDFTYPLDKGKGYLLSCWLYIESITVGGMLIELQDIGTSTTRYSQDADYGKIGSWQHIYVKIPKNNTLVGDGFRIFCGNMGNPMTGVSYFDSIMLNELTDAEATEIDSMTPEQIADRYNFVNSLQPLKNPWIYTPGRNLLPPFTGIDLVTISTVDVTGPYSIDFTTTSANGNAYFTVDVLPNTNYMFSCECGTNGRIAVYNSDASVTMVGYGNTPRPFNSGSETKVRLYFRHQAIGTTTFTNPQLELGSTATPFVPQQPKYSYVEGEFYGHGDVRDEIYDDGNGPNALRKWKRMALDGSLGWAYEADHAGFKRVKFTEFADMKDSNAFDAVKHDGSVLVNAQSSGGTDRIYKSGGFIYLSVSDTDSGWSEGMSPNTDTIKAYFNGWQLCNDDGSTPYNGLDTYNWKSVVDGTGKTRDVAYVRNNLAPNYTPYSLLYQLDEPYTEPATVEGDLSLHDGWNQIEYGEGIVVREAAHLTRNVSNTHYFINDTSIAGLNPLKERTSKILNVYADTDDVTSLFEVYTSTNAYGYQAARIPVSDYDPNAAYSVTYIPLDTENITTNVTTADIQYATNDRTILDQTVQNVAVIGTRLSVVENKYAQKQQPDYIKAVLLNGWANHGVGKVEAGYMLDEFGFVHIRGFVKSGSTANPLTIMYLPKGYRPSQAIDFISISRVDPVTRSMVTIEVTSAGKVNIHGDNIGNSWLSLNIPPFRAEQ